MARSGFCPDDICPQPLSEKCRNLPYADVEWLNHKFTLVDTGGIEPESKDIILSQMRDQAQIAIDTANVIKDSEEKGIVIIHQELALIPYMTIGENMYLGNERGKSFSINWNETYGEADKYLKIVGLEESSRTLIKDIGVGKQQLVEIAKELAKHAKLLILDEPTASLNEDDSQALLDLLLKFKEQGMTSIIISHKLNEISYVADKITVIRDGSTIETLDKKVDDFSEQRMMRAIKAVHSISDHTSTTPEDLEHQRAAQRSVHLSQ